MFTLCPYDRWKVIWLLNFLDYSERKAFFHLCISHVHFLFEIVHIICLYFAGALVTLMLTFMSYFYIWSTLCTSNILPAPQSSCLRARGWWLARSQICRFSPIQQAHQKPHSVLSCDRWCSPSTWSLHTVPGSWCSWSATRRWSRSWPEWNIKSKTRTQTGVAAPSEERAVAAPPCRPSAALQPQVRLPSCLVGRELWEEGVGEKPPKPEAHHEDEQKTRAGRLPWRTAVLTAPKSFSRWGQLCWPQGSLTCLSNCSIKPILRSVNAVSTIGFDGHYLELWGIDYCVFYPCSYSGIILHS